MFNSSPIHLTFKYQRVWTEKRKASTENVMQIAVRRSILSSGQTKSASSIENHRLLIALQHVHFGIFTLSCKLFTQSTDLLWWAEKFGEQAFIVCMMIYLVWMRQRNHPHFNQKEISSIKTVVFFNWQLRKIRKWKWKLANVLCCEETLPLNWQKKNILLTKQCFDTIIFEFPYKIKAQ